MPRRGYSALYEAIQQAFEPEDMTEERIEQWLVHGDSGSHKVKWGTDDSGNQRYKVVEGKGISPGSRRIARELSKTKEVYDKLKKIENKVGNLSSLQELDDEAKSLKVHSDTIRREITQKLLIVEKEEKEAIEKIKRAEEREIDLAEDKATEEEQVKLEVAKREYREATTIEELEQAESALPSKVLGGIRSGATRRAPSAFRAVFGTD